MEHTAPTTAVDQVAPIDPLSATERTELDALLQGYRMASGAALEALKIIQKHRRWISDQSLQSLADYLKLSIAELDSIASFYSEIIRQPVGENLIQPCMGRNCMQMGGDALHQCLTTALGIDEGETTKDGRYTLISKPCQEACDFAPVLQINDQLHTQVQRQDIDGLLKKLKPVVRS